MTVTQGPINDATSVPIRTKIWTDESIGYVLFRLTLGVNIAMHGLVRLWAPAPFRAFLEKTFKDSGLSPEMVQAMGFGLPWIETAVGILLILGLGTRWALIAGALTMISLTFGMTLVQNWEIAGIQLIYAFAYAALLILRRYNALSIDSWVKTHQ